MKTRRRVSSLASIFPSPAMGRLVVFFIVHPGQRFHLGALMRLTGLPSASIQTELRRMARMGALRRDKEGNRVFYTADESHPSWRAWMLLLRSCAHPTDVLREALVDAVGIEIAFVFGSAARGDTRADSDLDLLLVGDENAQLRARHLLSEAQILVNPELDVITYDRKQFSARVRSGNAFVQRVLGEPKEWVRGDADALGGDTGTISRRTWRDIEQGIQKLDEGIAGDAFSIGEVQDLIRTPSQ